MNESEMELQAIRQKLQSLQAETPSYESEPLPWSPSPSVQPTLPLRSQPTPQDAQTVAQLAATVETLRHRTAQKLYPVTQPVPVVSPHPAPNTSVPAPQISPAEREAAQHLLDLGWQRLKSQGDKINALSQAQEAAILEFKALAERLERDLRRQEILGEQGVYSGYGSHPVCEYESAIVPLIEQSPQGIYRLTHRPVDLYQAEREASLNAQALRDRAHARDGAFHPFPQRNGLDWQTMFEEPWQMLQSVYHWGRDQFQALLQPTEPAPIPTHRKRSRSRITALDVLIWVGGGVITRLGLNLMLSAFPILWLPAIAIIVILSAWALYRAVLMPRTDINFGLRLLMGIIGLLIGGHL